MDIKDSSVVLTETFVHHALYHRQDCRLHHLSKNDPDQDLNIARHWQFSSNPSRTPRPLFARPQTLGGTPPLYNRPPSQRVDADDGACGLIVKSRQTTRHRRM